MTSTFEFIAQLDQQDIKLWLDGERLRINAPEGTLSPAVIAQLKERKMEIMAFLRENQAGSTVTTIQPLDDITRTEPLPLSFAQQRLWFLAQLEGTSDAYNIPTTLRLDGPLDVGLFNESWQQLEERHEALRTTFPIVDGQPRQQINPPSFKLELIDLSDLPKDEQEAEVARLSRQEGTRPFDLVNGPLWRVRLLRLGAQEHVLLLTMHHIISDGWSIGVLMRDFSALYAQQGHTLPQLPIQYADFAVWQRKWLSGEVLQEQLDYWKKQLADAPPLLTLPTDHPRPAVQSYRGANLFFTLPKALHAELNSLSQKHNTTLFMTLQAAFAVLLSRYSAQDDICVGTPIANRQVAELENLIGLFINTLVLRNDLSGNPTFSDFLSRVSQVALDGYQRQALPFELVVETVQPERSLSHSPLFQVMFTLHNKSQRADLFSRVAVNPIEVEQTVAKFDLTLTMQEHEEGLIGWWEYNTDLFERATIERMAGHFQTLLEGIVANPDQPIAHLPLLSESEKHQLLVEWNDTAADYPFDKCIHQLFEQQVARTPEAIALVFDDQQLTYRELNARANQLAHHLIAQGVGPDVLVGICIPRSIEMVVGLLGILKAGGAYVPLDPNYPNQRLQFMLEDAKVKVLLTDSKLIETMPQVVPLLSFSQEWSLIRNERDSNPVTRVKPNHMAYCIYTSGSTGRPKGVQIEHQSLTNFLHTMQRSPGLTANDRLLAVTTISFDIAALELYLPLVVGGQVILASLEESSNGLLLLEKLRDATIMQATPATWRMLLAAGWQDTDPTQIKVLCGGEGLPDDLAQDLHSRASELWNMYGPTETTLWSTTTKVTRELASRSVVSIGQPILNTQIYILDRHQQPVPIGVAGELHIGGAGVARGYLNRPQLTSEKFIPNPFSPPKACAEERSIGGGRGGARLYKTGDLCRYLPDGNIEFLGRADYQVKIRGFRIELGEIEATLRQCVGVREVVVVVREEPIGKRLVAYVVGEGKGGETVPELVEGELAEVLRAAASQKLPHYMIPSAFVSLEAMPLTPNGKINRRALPAPTSLSQTTYVAPQNEIEREIAQVWQEVLTVDKVGVHDNFFELGGHSLLTIQLHRQLRDMYEQKLAITDFFRYPTVSALAAHLSKSTGTRISKQPNSTREQDRAKVRRTRRAKGRQRRERRQKSRRR